MLAYASLMFGWTVSGFLFQSMSNVLSAWLRMHGFPVVNYLDDILAMARFKLHRALGCSAAQSCNNAMYALLETQFRAGVFISMGKCGFEPVLVVMFLGLLVDFAGRRFVVGEAKMREWDEIRLTLLRSSRPDFRTLRRFHGKCQFFAMAARMLPIFCRTQQWVLRVIVRTGPSFDWGKHPAMLAALRAELTTLGRLADPTSGWNGAAWDDGRPHATATLWTDASKRGWGAVYRSQDTELAFDAAIGAGASFSDVESAAKDILDLEALGVLRGIRSIIEHPRVCIAHRTFNVYIDNHDLYKALSSGGKRRQFVNDVVKEIALLGLQFDFHVNWYWIPSGSNPADPVSRQNPEHEAALARPVFLDLWSRFGPFTCDLFASPGNAHHHESCGILPFATRLPVPASAAWLGVDALSLDVARFCVGGGVIFAFPPLPLVPHVVAFAEQQRLRILLVWPDVGDARWRPRLMHAARAHHVIGEPGATGVIRRPSAHGYVDCALRRRWRASFFDFS